jgi:hypothetical protein
MRWKEGARKGPFFISEPVSPTPNGIVVGLETGGSLEQVGSHLLGTLHKCVQHIKR